MGINECSILNRIRKCSLWAFLVSATVVLVVEILEVWNAIETQDVYRRRLPELNGWGKIENTFSIIMGISLVVLLALLIANRAKAIAAPMEKTMPTKKAAPAKKPATKK
ncbi:MAG: hypothetical protein JW722_01260 [Demequinaceae bacterium]|nr:hypothetical protein [Demequinaceae bacterium]